MNITFYNNYSDNRVVNKSISLLNQFPCAAKEPCSIMTPTIQVSRTTFNQWHSANYAYLDIFKRYYYIDDMVVQNGGIVEVQLTVDVLMSYKNQISGISTVVARQENINNKYIPDNLAPIRVKRIDSYMKIGELPKTNNCYILTVNGGNPNES